MSKIIKRVLILISPTLIGQMMVRVPALLDNVVYWAGPAVMIVYWVWVGTYYAKRENMSYAPALLWSHAGVFLSAILFIALTPYGIIDAPLAGFLHTLSVFALPLMPLIMVAWLFITDTSMDIYGTTINMIGCLILLTLFFSAGFGYARHQKKDAAG